MSENNIIHSEEMLLLPEMCVYWFYYIYICTLPLYNRLLLSTIAENCVKSQEIAKSV